MQDIINNRKKKLRIDLLKNRIRDFDGEKKIYEKLILFPKFISSETVLVYVSKENEIDTIKFIEYCFRISKVVAVPKVLNGNLIFKIINNFEDLETGYFNLSEPKKYCKELKKFDNSICITPALACDTDGYRIGYGKGFYDRFLMNYNGYSLALCFQKNIIDIPKDNNDLKVNFVLTE